MSLKQKLLNPLMGARYSSKVLATAPDNIVGFWPQNEGAGAVSYDKGPHGHDGAYTGVTLGQPGIGDGNTCPLFDGTNDYNDIHSAGLANDNLLSNPGFETAGGGGADIWANWTETAGDGALANEAGAPHEGSDAAKATAGGTANTKVAQAVTTVAGKKYRLRFYSKDDGTNAGRYGIYDVSNSADIVAITATAVAASYAATVVEFTAPAGCTSVRIDLWCPAVNTKIAYFDACEVRSMDGFLGDEGTLLAWAKTDGWEDAANRGIATMQVVGASSYILFRKTTVNNTFNWRYQAGGVQETITTIAHAVTTWQLFGLTWSATADEMRCFIGVQVGLTQTSLGTWVGDLSNTTTIVGAEITTPGAVWDGSIGPVALWNTPLTADQIAYLAKV